MIRFLTTTLALCLILNVVGCGTSEPVTTGVDDINSFMESNPDMEFDTTDPDVTPAQG